MPRVSNPQHGFVFPDKLALALTLHGAVIHDDMLSIHVDGVGGVVGVVYSANEKTERSLAGNGRH